MYIIISSSLIIIDKFRKPFKAKSTKSKSSITPVLLPTPSNISNNNNNNNNNSNTIDKFNNSKVNKLIQTTFIETESAESLPNILKNQIPIEFYKFCENALSKCGTNDRDVKFIEQYLTSLLKTHLRNDTLFSTDWEAIILPEYVVLLLIINFILLIDYHQVGIHQVMQSKKLVIHLLLV